jgi:hypothetical protein
MLFQGFNHQYFLQASPDLECKKPQKAYSKEKSSEGRSMDIPPLKGLSESLNFKMYIKLYNTS